MIHHKTGTPREQVTPLPEAIEDYIADDNPVRFIDAFLDKLNLLSLVISSQMRRNAEITEEKPPALPRLSDF